MITTEEFVRNLVDRLESEPGVIKRSRSYYGLNLDLIESILSNEIRKREEEAIHSSTAVASFRADELDAVMYSVRKWLPDDYRKTNPATEAADAREIALKAIERERDRVNTLVESLQLLVDAIIGKTDATQALGIARSLLKQYA